MFLWSAQVFAASKDTVDLLSFDPGLVNAGVVHLRVDAVKRQFCVLHAALINVRNPFRSFSLESVSSNSRSRKPEHVEPYCSTWPDVDFAPLQSRAHLDRLAEIVQATAKDDLKFEDQVAMMSFALQSVDWLNGSDPNLSYVLVEVQDPVNAKMRSVGHSVQTFYESLNARLAHQSAAEAQRADALDLVDTRQLRVRYVSSRLKLSDAVLSVLGDTLRFGATNDNDALGDKLRATISTRSHAAKKSSAVQVFKVLAEQAPDDHPFFGWLSKQRSTKHNILDALLQALSFLMQESIGFESGVLNGMRKDLQRQRAKQRRETQSADRASVLGKRPLDKERPLDEDDDDSLGVSAAAAADQQLPNEQRPAKSTSQNSVPKRRKISTNVPVDLS